MCDFLPFIIEVLKHVCRKWTSFENFLDPPCVVLAFLVLLGGPSFGSTPHTPTKQRRSPTTTSLFETTLLSIESNIIDCSVSRLQSFLPGSAISWSCNYPTTELHPPALSATMRRNNLHTARSCSDPDLWPPQSIHLPSSDRAYCCT